MKIKIYNDCKEKSNSWEVSLEEEIIDLRGYGATKEESLKNFKKELEKIIIEFRDLIDFE